MDQEVHNANSKLELLFHIHKKKEDRLHEMNMAPAFFQLVIDALTTDTFVSFARLYDVNPNSSSLWDLTSFVQNNLRIFTEEAHVARNAGSSAHWYPERQITNQTVIDHKRQLRANAVILKKLNLRRNKRFAHRDRTYVDNPDQLKKQAPVSYANLRTLAKTAFYIVNTYSIAFDGVHLSFEPINLFDIDRILDALHAYRKGFVGHPTGGAA